jgi:hypothetical protein
MVMLMKFISKVYILFKVDSKNLEKTLPRNRQGFFMPEYSTLLPIETHLGMDKVEYYQ